MAKQSKKENETAKAPAKVPAKAQPRPPPRPPPRSCRTGAAAGPAPAGSGTWTKFGPNLAKTLGRKNVLALPKIQKIVVNMGVGEATTEKKHLDEAVDALSQITGQKPLIAKARQSVAGFKLREGMPIGAQGHAPRRADVRVFGPADFAGAAPRPRLSRAEPQRVRRPRQLQPRLAEQLVFPELNPDKFHRVQGMNVTIVTSTESNDEARELLKSFGMPFAAPAGRRDTRIEDSGSRSDLVKTPSSILNPQS